MKKMVNDGAEKRAELRGKQPQDEVDGNTTAECQPSAHLEPRDYGAASKALSEARQPRLPHPRAPYPHSPFGRAVHRS